MTETARNFPTLVGSRRSPAWGTFRTCSGSPRLTHLLQLVWSRNAASRRYDSVGTCGQAADMPAAPFHFRLNGLCDCHNYHFRLQIQSGLRREGGVTLPMILPFGRGGTA